MNKIRIIVAIFALSLLFTGCKAKNNNDVIDNEANNEITEEVEAKEEKEIVEINKDELSDAERELLSILDNIQVHMEFGTAGSSLKSVKYTSNLMNWSIGTSLSEEQIEKVIALQIGSLSNAEEFIFKEKMELIEGTYKNLINQALNQSTELLEESGNDKLEDHAWLDIISKDVTSLPNMDFLIAHIK